MHASEIAPIRAATIAPLFRAAAPLLEFRLENKPATVTITGAAGQIGYALAFRVASGQMLGTDRPLNLNLLEITPALPSLAGVVMELADCALPTLRTSARKGVRLAERSRTSSRPIVPVAPVTRIIGGGSLAREGGRGSFAMSASRLR